MEFSPAFKKACRNLVQDMDDLVSSLDDLVLYSLLGIDAAEAAEIKPVLDELLSGRYDHDQLKEIWWSTPTSLVFYEGRDVVTFLTRMREYLDAPGPPYLGPKK
jgi:hypothetical protein